MRSARDLPVSLGLAAAAVAVTAAAEATTRELPLILRPFDHGFADVPAAVHLGANLVLLLLLGARLERAMRTADVLVLTGLAHLAYVAAMWLAGHLWGLDVVGLSGIVWAWLAPARLSARTEPERRAVAPVVWLMAVWIPIGFAAVVAAGAGPGDRLAGALLANFFHAVGAIVGLLFAVGTRDRVGRP